MTDIKVKSPVVYHQNSGQCHIRVGPMCSGKTLWLNNRLTLAADTQLTVLRISHQKDQRLTAGMDKKNGVTSHHSQFIRLSTKVNNIVVTSLAKVEVDDYQVIGIDEGQFYPDLVPSVKQWVREQGKIVYVSSLDADSNGNLFGGVSQLMPIAQTFKKKTARCTFCLVEGKVTPAIITARLVNKGGQTLVGGLDTYSPACLVHHGQHNIRVDTI